ncbi:MAG TPA: TraM recognition domain-containing protein [Pyrinomonadaceae bacterium]|nr:TraM recognition domain-containing protein [Pyrinomonadaceae bacterium]
MRTAAQYSCHEEKSKDFGRGFCVEYKAKDSARHLADLRRPGAAIYIVMNETQASEYHILLELLFGLAAIEMQASTHKNATPVLMALDEAGNVAPPKLQDKLKIARFRNTPYLLGFQDVPQIKRKFQEHGGKAVLAGMKNQIFLPGIDPETGAYASSMLGPATMLSAPRSMEWELSMTLNGSLKAEET